MIFEKNNANIISRFSEMKEIETFNESIDASKSIQVIESEEKTKGKNEKIDLLRPVQEISFEKNRFKYCCKNYCRMDKVFY